MSADWRQTVAGAVIAGVPAFAVLIWPIEWLPRLCLAALLFLGIFLVARSRSRRAWQAVIPAVVASGLVFWLSTPSHLPRLTVNASLGVDDYAPGQTIDGVTCPRTWPRLIL